MKRIATAYALVLTLLSVDHAAADATYDIVSDPGATYRPLEQFTVDVQLTVDEAVGGVSVSLRSLTHLDLLAATPDAFFDTADFVASDTWNSWMRLPIYLMNSRMQSRMRSQVRASRYSGRSFSS